MQSVSLEVNDEKQCRRNYLDLLTGNANATCSSKNLACLSLASFLASNILRVMLEACAKWGVPKRAPHL
jgi:hypothetical protein